MASMNAYRQICEEILSRYVDVKYANIDARNEAVFDEKNDRYLIVSVGWGIRPAGRVHGCLLHLDVIGGKVWIQRDGTQDGIALELEEAGIPKENIVLGFKRPELRPHTGYAAA